MPVPDRSQTPFPFPLLFLLLPACAAEDQLADQNPSELTDLGGDTGEPDDGDGDGDGDGDAPSPPDTSATSATTDGGDATTTIDPPDDPSDTTGADDPPPPPPMASPGCGSTPGSITSGTIEVDGMSREFILDLPSSYDPNTPYPLVFANHGLTENMNTAATRYQIPIEWEDNAIGIYPNAVYHPQFDAPGWYIEAESIDMDFFDALWELARQQLCVDESRVFAQGFSRGGMYSHTLGCVRPYVMRAIAAGGARLEPATCEVPVGVWMMHANNDELVPFASGVAARDVWLEVNGCSDVATTWEPEPMCVAYEDCDPDAPVVWCETNMGHWWMVDWQNPAVLAFFRSFGSRL